jgi:HK97 family phage major capsid protein
MRFTTLPVLLAFLVGLAHMPALNIVQINAWNHGTEKVEPWRSKLSTPRIVGYCVTLPTRLRAWLADLTVPLLTADTKARLQRRLTSQVGAVGNIKQLLQDEADNRKAIAALKKEGRTLNAIPASAIAATATTPEVKARTPEQTARLTAIIAELDVLEAKAEVIDADLLAARRLQDDERRTPTVPATDPVIVGDNNEEKKAASLGEVMQAMAYQLFSSTGRRDKAAYILPNGVAVHVIAAIGGTEALQAAASGASSGNPESGGLLVRNEWNTSLLDKAKEEGKLAPRCFPMPIGDGFDGVEAPFVDETSRATGSRWGGVQVYRGAEAAAMTGAQPKLGKFEMRLEDLFGLFYATDRVLRDATLMQALAEKAFASEFAFKLDDEIFRGTGAGQCLGIVGQAPTVSVPKENGQAAGTVVYENVIKMFARLLARCMPGAEWFINQAVWPQLFRMSLSVGTGGVPAFMPPSGLSGSPYGTLMGLPINVIEQASAPGTVGDIVLANFKNDYAVISKPMTSASSIHVLFTSNQTTFRWVWPVIGKPVLSAAITPYKGADTLGPFVTLATRA